MIAKRNPQVLMRHAENNIQIQRNLRQLEYLFSRHSSGEYLFFKIYAISRSPFFNIELLHSVYHSLHAANKISKPNSENLLPMPLDAAIARVTSRPPSPHASFNANTQIRLGDGHSDDSADRKFILPHPPLILIGDAQAPPFHPTSDVTSEASRPADSFREVRL